VFNPSGRGGPRLSIDASRVEIRGEIGASGYNPQQIINDEENYPNRVVREPLSAADAAAGYTAGRIVALYSGLANIGRTVAETVDFQLDWTLPPVLAGETQVYGAATWQPTLRTRRRPGQAWLDRVGYRDGPLEWRGNVGVQWARGPLTLDLNVQHLGRSSPLWSPASVVVVQNAARNQQRTYVPSRAYFDLTARRRFDFAADHALRALEARRRAEPLGHHAAHRRRPQQHGLRLPRRPAAAAVRAQPGRPFLGPSLKPRGRTGRPPGPAGRY
jgi:iron complex outermembrane receptor protein